MRAWLSLVGVLLGVGSLSAQVVYPGRTIYLTPAVSSGLVWPLSGPGPGLTAALTTGFSGWPLKGIGLTTGLNYLYLPRQAADGLVGAGADLRLEAKVPAGGGLVEWLVGLRGGLDFAFNPAPSQPIWEAGISSSFGFHLAERNFLTLELAYEQSFSPHLPSRLSMSLSLKKSHPWMWIAPEVGPEFGLEPHLFSPDADGLADVMVFSFAQTEPGSIRDWSLSIYDQKNNLFKTFSGQLAPPAQLSWDGSSETGELVSSASDYRVVYRVTDELGRINVLQDRFTADVLVLKEGDRLKIRLPNIEFPPNSIDFKNLPQGFLVEKNRAVLNRLVEIFTRFPEYSILIEGYANVINWQDADKAQVEQAKELIPLSQSRAQAVRAALVALGIKPARISVKGLGGQNPVVPFSDQPNVWKNRRVEIILKK